jgi:DNA-binding transcriptional ArsR family regulator
MTTTTSIEELSRTIERLVREHIAASRAAASAAVQRAFEGSVAASPITPRRSTKPSKPTARRTQEQVAELGKRLCQAVAAGPGRLMSELAAELDVSPRQLLRPMTLLRRAGQVRSAGQRNHTRYFPTVHAARASA